MNWEKLQVKNYYTDPVEYIYSSSCFEIKDYDNLYENQNNLSHKCWKDFDKKYRIGFEFKENFDQLDLQKEILCLWFFKERSDLHRHHVNLCNKKLLYLPNTFLITKSKEIEFVHGKKYIRNPFLQLDMSVAQYNEIVFRFQK